MTKKGYFIVGTDTDVGKTISVAAIGLLLKARGVDVGVMKPVQCGGVDTQFLTKILELNDARETINPYFAKEPLSPHLAFARAKKRISLKKIETIYRQLAVLHDIVLVEGAGGVMVPVTKDTLMLDIVRLLNLEVIVVARCGLGTINHTLLTIEQIRQAGLTMKGILFCDSDATEKGLPAQTNPAAIARYGRVSILGTIPFVPSMKDLSQNVLWAQENDFVRARQDMLKACQDTVKINAFIQKKVSSKSKADPYVLWDKQYVWHPFTQMKDWLQSEPLVIARAQGSYLFDTKGNRYLDGVSSLWVTVHGHKKQEINVAIKKQIDTLDHSTLLGCANTPSVALAKKLVEMTPKGLDKVFYSDSGSTSVEIAIKMAYQYWQNIGRVQKRNLVHLAHSYHGDTLGSVSVGGIDLFHKVYKHLIAKTIQVDFPDCYRDPRGAQAAYHAVDKIEELFKKQHQEIAAFIVEPIVQGAAGMIMWPKGILKKMAQIAAKYDILFIVDEVATGFGRTGTMFACEHEAVSPDIMCLAKGITGGVLPLAATLTSQKIYDGFCFDYVEQKTFFHGHTYTGNPICCAAALASIDLFEKENVIAKLSSKIKYLTENLKPFKKIKNVGDVRQRGFMVGIELVEDKSTKQAFDWEKQIGVRVCHVARSRGVLLRPLGNVIVLMPPLSISKLELKELCDVTYWAINSVINELDMKKM